MTGTKAGSEIIPSAAGAQKLKKFLVQRQTKAEIANSPLVLSRCKLFKKKKRGREREVEKKEA